MANHFGPVPLAGRTEYELLREDIAFLVEEVCSDMKRFPQDLRPLPIEHATSESLLPTDWSFAIVTMPCWIGHGLGVAQEFRRRAMVAGYYLFHFVLGTDRLVDRHAVVARTGNHEADHVTLSPHTASSLTLFHWLAIRQYQHLFPPTAPFWAALEDAHLAWGESLRWEREGQPYLDVPLDRAMEREGNKCALGYVNCAAVVHGSNHLEYLPSIAKATSEINIIMNLIDDADDWIVDLREGRHNSFVALAIAFDCIKYDSVNSHNLLSAMLCTSLLDDYVHQVAVMTERVSDLLAPVPTTLFTPFLEDLRDLAVRYRREFREKIPSYSAEIFGVPREPEQSAFRREGE